VPGVTKSPTAALIDRATDQPPMNATESMSHRLSLAKGD